MTDNHTATQDRTGQEVIERVAWCVPANDIMQVKDLPNKSWCAHSHVENKWREGHGSDLEGQDDDDLFFYFFGPLACV